MQELKGLSRATPPILPSSLSSQLRSLDSLTALKRRERKRLTLPPLQTLPQPKSLLVIPDQCSNIRLHIPVQRERRVLALRNLPLHVRDLVLGLLAGELDDAWAAAGRVGLAGFLRFLALVGGFGGWVDVGVGVEGRIVGGDDGVPDNELGGRDGRG